MAVLVAQDEPDAMRRTRSQGNGGVDLMIPMATVGTSGRLHVLVSGLVALAGDTGDDDPNALDEMVSLA